MGAEIERWPDLLPHYDADELLYRAGDYRVARMHARRDVIPVSWTTVQLADRDAALIRFRHVRGVTRGMYVEWQLREVEETTSVTLAHWFHPPWTPLGRLLARWIVGDFFIHNIASKTLARIKQVAEAEVSQTKSEVAK